MPEDNSNSGNSQHQSTQMPETFSAQYVAELRAENEKLRKLSIDSQSQVENMKKSVEDASKASKEAIEAERVSFKNKLMLREIQSALVGEGFLDKDIASLLAPKVAEEAKLSMDDKDTVVGLKEAIEGLKKNKPELFRSMQSSSLPANSQGKPQPNSGTAPADAMKASDAEFQAMMSGLGISL